MDSETAPLFQQEGCPPPLPHQAMPTSRGRQQQQASYQQRCKSHSGDRAGQGFAFGVRNLISLPNTVLVQPFPVLPAASQGGNTATANPHQPAWHRQEGSRGKTPSHPQIPDLALPSPTTCPSFVSRAHLHTKGILQRGGGACSSIPVAVPILATAAASAPPGPGFLSRLWVWSELDALKKLFMCVCECVLIT